MEYGTCPVCNGTKRVPVPEDQQRYKKIIAGYDETTDTYPCTNCGFQYMFGASTGQVRLNKQGVPCTHNYEGWSAGNCITDFTCTECGDKYTVDTSG